MAGLVKRNVRVNMIDMIWHSWSDDDDDIDDDNNDIDDDDDNDNDDDDKLMVATEKVMFAMDLSAFWSR